MSESFLDTGIAPKDEIVQGCHCMAPVYLEDQIERSRRNLGLETIDLYYLHNVETQLEEIGRQAFRERLARAIETLEAAADAGKIAAWGFATWNGLRVPPEHPEHLSLASIWKIAEEVAGAGHRFRGVQLPVNLAMAHAVAFRSQQSPSSEKIRVPALEAASELGLGAFGSASLLQGRLAVELPDQIVQAFPEADTPARRALQFSRSAPGLTSALVGVSDVQHASENFGLAAVPPAEPDRILGIFGADGN